MAAGDGRGAGAGSGAGGAGAAGAATGVVVNRWNSTKLIACGSHLILFTTGRGTPYAIEGRDDGQYFMTDKKNPRRLIAMQPRFLTGGRPPA